MYQTFRVINPSGFRKDYFRLLMRKDGKIILIEDDEDDCEFFIEVYNKLGYKNELIIINDSTLVLDYIKRPDVHPFLIISDINMPKMSGFELRNLILGDVSLSEKAVPYIFFTTSKAQESVIKAYQMSVQGFFYKSYDIKAFATDMKMIIDYWKLAATPPY